MRKTLLWLGLVASLAVAACGSVPLVGGESTPQPVGHLERRIAAAWAGVEAQTRASQSVRTPDARARRIEVMDELIAQLSDAQKNVYMGALRDDRAARAEASAIMDDVERVLSQLNSLDAGR